MKKYIVKYKDNGKVFGEYNSRKEASDKVMEYIHGHYYISPFDFVLEEVECKEVNEVIADFDSARKFLGIKPNDEFTVVRKEHSESDIQFDDVASLVDDINPKHIEALMALNKLFTIAEAWNKSDGFVPDFSDCNQAKYYPWFKYEYDKDAAGFVIAATNFGSRFCFKSSARSAQFGKQFAHLYNKVFL